MKNLSSIIVGENPILNNAIYTTQDVSNLLKVSTRTIQRWRDNGQIKFSAIGSKFYYFHSDIVDMLKTNVQ